MDSVKSIICHARYIVLWSVNKHSYTTATNTLKRAHHQTYSRIGRCLDDVALHSLLTHPPSKLGGVGRYVQIDESVFVRRKVCHFLTIPAKPAFAAQCGASHSCSQRLDISYNQTTIGTSMIESLGFTPDHY